jgi:hypothetical protein
MGIGSWIENVSETGVPNPEASHNVTENDATRPSLDCQLSHVPQLVVPLLLPLGENTPTEGSQSPH